MANVYATYPNRILGSAPSAPSLLTAVTASDSQINLAWHDNSGNETGFKIERSPTGSGSWSQITTVSAGVTTYNNTGLSAATIYYYRVRAYNSFGNSSYSNTANATTTLTPQFMILSNGSITPTIGTAGTFARASTLLYPTSRFTLASAGSGSAAAQAFSCGKDALVTLGGGVWMSKAITNYVTYSSDISNAAWVASGGATVPATNISDPLGGTSGSKLAGTGAGDSFTFDSGQTAASTRWTAGLWLKTNSGSRTVTLSLVDLGGGVAPVDYTCTVSTVWQQYPVYKAFAGGASGNVGVKITVNNTTGYEIYAYGCTLVPVNGGPGAPANQYDMDLGMLPIIITSGATADTAQTTLKYAGTELTTSTNKRTVSLWFYMPPSNTGNWWDHNQLFCLEGNAFVDQGQCRLSASTATLQVSFDGDSMEDTGDTPAGGLWHNLIMAMDGSGDNEVYLDGVSIYTSATTFASAAGKYLVMGARFSDGSGAKCTLILGWTDVFINKRLSDAEALYLYNAEASRYNSA